MDKYICGAIYLETVTCIHKNQNFCGYLGKFQLQHQFVVENYPNVDFIWEICGPHG